MALDQGQANPQLVDALEARRSALDIIKTTTTPSGQILDWVPIASQVPSGKIANPPPPIKLRDRADDARKSVKPASFELDDLTIERGPSDTVPLIRPDISRLTRTIALKDYLRKRGGANLNRIRPNRRPTDPDPAGYFHNIDNQNGKFYGWDGYLNVWDPTINIPAGPGDDHSILQVWLQNYAKPQTQSLEAGWTVDQSLNGDAQPHIFTYYTTNGYEADGDNLGGYNSLYKGWVQYSSASTTGGIVFPGIRINCTSKVADTQYDVSMKFQRYQDPKSTDVNWWVAVEGIWMGYYPAGLFNGGLGYEVDWIGAGGEVYSSLANPEATRDQMGSGLVSSAGWSKAAFLRNLRVQSDMSGTMQNNGGFATSDAAIGGGADPYTIQMNMNSGSSWGSYFYVGGPTSV